MNAHVFVLALTCGAALLALWILGRFTSFGPRTVVWAIVHVIAAYALLRMLPVAVNAAISSSVPAAPYLTVFGVALPLFVYAFLSGGWVARVAMGMLRR